jgi:carboxypeptidase family protein
MKSSSYRLPVLALACLLPSCIFAQIRDLGAVKGHVQDAQGAAIQSAQVELKNANTGITLNSETDRAGDYGFSGLPVSGSYTITVHAPKFHEAQQQNVRLRAGVTAQLNFTLSVSAEPVQVEVYGEAGGVVTDSNQIGTRLDISRIESTPILNNRLTSLQLLDSSVRLAQTTGDLFLNETLVAANGSGRRQTTYSIDNATADDSWGRQTIFTALPFASVQEFTVLTSATSAEYGRTTSAAVNIVTKSGTDTFHGDFTGMGRPAFAQANLPLAPQKTANVLAQGSAAVSGPIIPDRTFFFGSVEYSSQQRDAVINTPIQPRSLFTGDFGQTLMFARLDHDLNASNRMTFRANLDRFSDTNPQDVVSGTTLPSAGRIFSRQTYALGLSDTATLSPSIVNEARLQWQLGSPITRFTPVQFGPQITLPGFYTVGESRSANLMNHQYSAGDTLSAIRGRHTLKAGADLIWSSSGGFGQEFGGGFVAGRFQVNPACAFVPISVLATLDPGSAQAALCTAGTPAQQSQPIVSTFTQSFGNQNYNIRETLWDVFLQDNWNLRQGLTLNLGLRYEMQTFTDDRNNLAPRLGFTWLLPHTRSTVFRGGYGIYYSEERTDLAAADILGGTSGLVTFSVTPGQPGFPTSFNPITNFPPGTVFPARDITVRPGQCAALNQILDVSALHFCPDALLNPYTQQWTFGIEREVASHWVLSADYVGLHTIDIERPVDLNAPAPFLPNATGETRSVAAANLTRPIIPVPGGFRRVLANANLGAANYNALQLRLNKQLSNRFSLLLSYTWSHAIDTVDQDAAQQDPADSNLLGETERATSIFDQRHNAALVGTYQLPMGFTFSTFAQLGSGFPYNITTGVDNNGDGSNSDRPFLNGALLPRNAGRGTPIYDVATALQKSFRLTERASLSLRAEAFNVFNHQNIYNRSGVFGNGATPPPTFGLPASGLANVGQPREMQFLARITF